MAETAWTRSPSSRGSGAIRLRIQRETGRPGSSTSVPPVRKTPISDHTPTSVISQGWRGHYCTMPGEREGGDVSCEGGCPLFRRVDSHCAYPYCTIWAATYGSYLWTAFAVNHSRVTMHPWITAFVKHPEFPAPSQPKPRP